MKGKVNVWNKKQGAWLSGTTIYGDTGQVMKFDKDGLFVRMYTQDEVEVLGYMGTQDNQGTGVYEGSQLVLYVSNIPEDSDLWDGHLGEDIKEYQADELHLEVRKTHYPGAESYIRMVRDGKYILKSEYDEKEYENDKPHAFMAASIYYINYFIEYGAVVVGNTYAITPGDNSDVIANDDTAVDGVADTVDVVGDLMGGAVVLSNTEVRPEVVEVSTDDATAVQLPEEVEDMGESQFSFETTEGGTTYEPTWEGGEAEGADSPEEASFEDNETAETEELETTEDAEEPKKQELEPTTSTPVNDNNESQTPEVSEKRKWRLWSRG